MAEEVLQNIGALGVIKDIPELLLPPGAMTDALNVRFDNQRIVMLPGDTIHSLDVRTIEGRSSTGGVFWPRPHGPLLLLGRDDGKVYGARPQLRTEWDTFEPGRASFECYDMTGDMPFENAIEFNFGLFGGGYAVFVNNGHETPRYALYDEDEDEPVLAPFPGWDYAGGTTTAAVLSTFGYSIVAANLTYTPDSGPSVRYPATIRVSAQAAPGSFPHTWEPSLETDSADEFELNSRTPIVGLAMLRSNMMVYCSDSIHTLTSSNGVLSVATYARDRGILNQRCVLEFEGKHLCVSRDDIYLNAGTGQFESILEGRMREFFQLDVDPNYLDRVFLFHNERAKEVCIGYRSVRKLNPHDMPDPDEVLAFGGCDTGLVWNYRENNFSFRELSGVRSAVLAPFLTATYDPDTEEQDNRFIENTNAVYLIGDTWLLAEVDGADGRVPYHETDAAIKRPRGIMLGANLARTDIFFAYVIRERLMFGKTPSQAALIQSIQVVQDVAREFLPWQRLLFVSEDTYFHGEEDGRSAFEVSGGVGATEVTIKESRLPRSKNLPLEVKTNTRPNQGGRFISYCIICQPLMRTGDFYDPLGLKEAPFSICMLSVDVKGEMKR